MKTKFLQLREELVSRRDFMHMGMMFFVSLLLSHAQALSSFSPWGIAFCMAAPYRYTLFAFAGSMLGYSFTGNFVGSGVYIAVLLLSCSAKLLIRPRDDAFAFTAILSFGFLFLGHMIQMLLMPAGILTWIFYFAESALCGAMTYLIGWGLSTILQKKGLKSLSLSQRAGLAVLWISFLISLAGLELFQIDLAMVTFAGCLMAASVYFGIKGVCVAGILGTFALVLYNPSWMAPAEALLIAGFFAAAFRPLGKLIQIFTFLIFEVFLGAFLGAEMVAPIHLAETAIGVGIFLLLPRRVFQYLLARSAEGDEGKVGQPITHEISSYLQFSAKTLLDLQGAIEDVSNRLDKITNSNMSVVYTKTAGQVCKKCSLNSFCWGKGYKDILLSLKACTKQLREGGKLDINQAPPFFEKKCIQYPAFADATNRNYEDFLIREQSARRISEARGVAIEQFSGVSDMLVEMSREISNISELDIQSTKKVCGVLQDHGIITEEVFCSIDRFSRMEVDLFLDDAPTKRTLADLAEDLSDELDREFEFPCVITAAGKTKVSFFESAALRVEFSAVQSANQNNPHCGDSYDFFMDNKGYAHVILSDGMGTGNYAAVDSAMTCAMLKKLLQAGFGFEAAFKLMNLSFFVKSREESLSTVDVCTIDLYTGRMKFCKAGACVSYVLRGNRVVEITTDSLPIGILQGIRYDKKETQVHKGDILVMLSDGVLMGGGSWIAEELPLLKKEPAGAIAARLCEEAKRRWLDGHSDDLTVLVTKIK